MKKKGIYFAVAILGLVGLFSVPLAQTNFQLFPTAAQNPGDYEVTLSTAPSSLTNSYQNSSASDIRTSFGNDVELSFVNAKQLANGFAQLANHGKIHNFGSTNDVLTGINGVSFTGSGSILFKPAVAKGLLMDISPISVSAGSSKVVVPNCDYFEIEAGDSGASLETLKFYYSCDSTAYDVKSINGTYTGIGDDSYTYKVTLTDGVASLVSLDKPSNNVNFTGTVTMSSKTRATMSFPSPNQFDYVVDYDGHSLTFVSKSGAVAAYVPQVSANRVYNVENFESYSATGQGYVSADAKYTTTGLRSQYYADYYTGSSSGEIGGNGWPIMTSTDNSNYNGSKGHNGSKVGIFKFSNGMGMRYISMNELYGVKRLIGKGSTLSLWARGAYTNQNYNTNHSGNTPMKVYAYYDSPLTPSNQTTVRESFEFTVQAGSEWQHFEFSLTSGRSYYGFGFYAQQSTGSTQYLPIDDIQIYTASPYAEYVAPVAVTGVTVSPSAASVEAGKTTALSATVAPSDATNKNVTWSSSNTSIATVSAEGVVRGVSAGNATITATTEDGGFTSTCAVTVTEPAGTLYPNGTFRTNVTVASASMFLVVAMGDSGKVVIRVGTEDVGATGYNSYNSSTGAFSIATNGSYSGMTYGNVTGTYDRVNNRLTNFGISGSLSSYVSNNGSITVNGATNFWDCDGTTSELQSVFKRRYSTNVDTSNADRIVQNTEQFVGGSSLKLRGTTSYDVRLNLNNDVTMSSVSNIGFWVFNPSASNINIRIWGYRAANLGSNFEVTDGVGTPAVAGQWTFIRIGFTSGTIYNFQIADFTKSGVYLSFDNIAIF